MLITLDVWMGIFFAADIEGVEGIGAVFEEVFFGFGELLAGYVFAVAVMAFYF